MGLISEQISIHQSCHKNAIADIYNFAKPLLKSDCLFKLATGVNESDSRALPTKDPVAAPAGDADKHSQFQDSKVQSTYTWRRIHLVDFGMSVPLMEQSWSEKQVLASQDEIAWAAFSSIDKAAKGDARFRTPLHHDPISSTMATYCFSLPQDDLISLLFTVTYLFSPNPVSWFDQLQDPINKLMLQIHFYQMQRQWLNTPREVAATFSFYDDTWYWFYVHVYMLNKERAEGSLNHSIVLTCSI